MAGTSIQNELKLVMFHIEESHMNFANALLTAVLKKNNITFGSRDEAANLCETLKQGLEAKLTPDDLSKSFVAAMTPGLNLTNTREMSLTCTSINDSLYERIHGVAPEKKAVMEEVKDKALEEAKDLAKTDSPEKEKDAEETKDATPDAKADGASKDADKTAKPGDKPEEKAEEKSKLPKPKPGRTNKVDENDIANAELYGINPTGITGISGINAVVQSGKQTGVITKNDSETHQDQETHLHGGTLNDELHRAHLADGDPLTPEDEAEEEQEVEVAQSEVLGAQMEVEAEEEQAAEKTAEDVPEYKSPSPFKMTPGPGGH